jgi:hypothetical protein
MYQGLIRSNFFSVLDLGDFELWCRRLGLEFLRKGDLAGFRLKDKEEVPDRFFNLESGKCESLEFWPEFCQHIAGDSVAMVISAGELNDEPVGWVLCINKDFQFRGTSLSAFAYTRAHELGHLSAADC